MVVAWPALGLTLLLSLYVFYLTFVPGLPTEPGFTLEHWTRLGDSYLYGKVIPNTFVVGVGSVVVTLFFAAPMAWLLNRTTMPFQRVFITLIALVAIIPGFVKAMAWLLLLQGRIGFINRFAMDTFGLREPIFDISSGPLGTAWLMGLTLTPTMFFLLAGPMRAIDPALEEAALGSGATRPKAVLRVSLPLVWPATLGGAIYTFMTAISIFEIPALLGGLGGQTPVLATELFFAVEQPTNTLAPAYGLAGVYSALIALPSLVGLYLYVRVLDQSRRYETITGKGYRPHLVDLGLYTWLGVGFVCLYILLGVGLPLLALVWASLLPILRLPSEYALTLLSFKNYAIFIDLMGSWDVIWNTVSLVVWSTFLAVFFSFAISWVVVRTNFKVRKPMDVLAILPHAIPGLAIAFALAMIAIVASKHVPWLPLKGTVAILVIANVVTRLAYCTRISNAALLQVGRELEESAWLSGARSLTTIWRILVPLVKPSLLYALLWSAMLTFREVSMALMLHDSQNTVMATRIWIMWRQGHPTEAAAAAVIMIVVVGALVLLAQTLASRSSTEQRAGTLQA